MKRRHIGGIAGVLLAGKATDKLAPLAASAVRAVKRCAPFEGLEALGARAGERFSITVNFQS